MNDQLHASRRRAVLAVAGLLARTAPVADPALGPWYLRVGGRFAGPVVRVVSSRRPFPGVDIPVARPSGGPSGGTCTLELGAATTAQMSGMIDSALAGEATREDITLFRGSSTGLVAFRLSDARVASLTVPRLDAASPEEPAVRVKLAWQGWRVSTVPDSFVVETPSPAAVDRVPLTVRVGGQPVPATSVGAWTMRTAETPGDLTLVIPETGLDTVFRSWMSQPGEIRPVTVSIGRYTLTFDAAFGSAEASRPGGTVAVRLAARRAALQVTPE